MLTKPEGTLRLVSRAVLDIVLERRRKTVVSESFAQFNDDNEPCADGDFVRNASKGIQILLGDPVVRHVVAGVFAERARRISGLGITRQTFPVLLSDEVKIAAGNIMRKSPVIFCSLSTIVVGISWNAGVLGHFDGVAVQGLISYSRTREPRGG